MTNRQPDVRINGGISARTLARAAKADQMNREARMREEAADVDLSVVAPGPPLPFPKRRARVRDKMFAEEQAMEAKFDLIAEIVLRAGLINKDFVEEHTAGIAETVRETARDLTSALGGWKTAVGRDGPASRLFANLERARSYEGMVASKEIERDEDYEARAKEVLNEGIDNLAGEISDRAKKTLAREMEIARRNKSIAREGRKLGRRGDPKPMRTAFEALTLWNAKRMKEEVAEDGEKAIEIAQANAVLQWATTDLFRVFRGEEKPLSEEPGDIRRYMRHCG